MFENIQLLSLSVRLLKFWGLLFECNWRRYLCLIFTAFLVFTQLVYFFFTNDSFETIIRNSYMFTLWFNTILRAYSLLYNRIKFEELCENLRNYYDELEHSKSAYIRNLLRKANESGKIMARGNLFLGILTSLGFGLYPLLTKERVLPFGSIIPGLNVYATPLYEFFYIFQMVVTPMGCCMYIPYTSLIVACIKFGIVMCKSLQHQLRELDAETMKVSEEIVACIQYQKRIIRYISSIDNLTAFIFLLDFIAFGTLLCALLLLLIIVKTTGQAIIFCAYITMILSQILALYWYANELREENLAVAAAAYDTPWFTFSISVQKNILLMILRAQKPSSITIGHIYPMTLQLFQSLLNASYSYFTLLKRVYR